MRARPASCLLSLGWGGGLLSKSAWLDTGDPTYRQILQQVSLYGRRSVRTRHSPKPAASCS
jgi:hypothetical protein